MSSGEEYYENGNNEEPPRKEASSNGANRDIEKSRNKNLSSLETDIAAKQRGSAEISRNSGQVGAIPSAGEEGVRSDLTTLEGDVAAKVNAAREHTTQQGQTILDAAYSFGTIPSKVDSVIIPPNLRVKNSRMKDNIDAVKNRERNRELNDLAPDVRANIQELASNSNLSPEDSESTINAEISHQERQVSSGYDGDDIQKGNLAGDEGQHDMDIADDPYYSTIDKDNMTFIPTQTSGKSFGLPDKFDGEVDINLPDENDEPQTYDSTGQGRGGTGATEPTTSQSDQYGGEAMVMHREGVQAFLSEQAVTDATNVVATKSEEEEKLDEKKKFRRYMMYGLIGLTLLLIAIVVPIVNVFGKVDPIEAPSATPTMVPSLSPSTNRFQDTVEFLSSEASFYDDFSGFNKTSPQYLAADWIANEDSLVNEIGSDNFIQRYILAVFYFSTGGDGWNDCGRNDIRCRSGFPWLQSNKKECQWDGIRCDEPNQVTRILIGMLRCPLGNNLVGTLPSELGYLSFLSSLTIVGGVFSGGKLTGTIPSELGLLTNLNSIYIQAHKITGTVPKELVENKPNLELLAITRQRLTGPLPTNFVSSAKLRELKFQGNQFTGTIPAEYGRFKNLDILELKNNNLNGTIPEEFYNLDFLTQLWLGGNNLSGTISSRVSKLTNLQYLGLGNNQLTGTLPSTLWEMPILSVVRVQNNQMTGTISEDIALLNDTFTILEGYNNQFSGEIPIAAFEAIPRLREVILHGNNLMIGNVSVELCEKDSLKVLTVPSTVNCTEADCCNLNEYDSSGHG